MKTTIFFLLIFSLVLAGCSPLSVVVERMNHVTPLADTAVELLEARYKADLRAASDPDAVRKCYDPLFEAHRAFLASFIAAKQALSFAASLENAGAIADVEIASAIKSVSEAIKAYDAFKRLSEGELSCGSSKRLGASTAGQPA